MIPKRSTGIPFKLKFLTALHFYGHGSYQKATGGTYIFAQSQASVSRCIKIVTNELIKIAPNYIKFPSTSASIAQHKSKFLRKFNIAGIVAALDGTHIAIHSPPVLADEFPGHLYINRKRYHSLNVLAACDADMRINFIDSKYPGSVHDSAIWQTSALKRHIEEQYNNNPNNRFWILGDSGFPIEPWLLTPLQNCAENTPGQRYNKCHKSTRNIIERCFGVLKARFRCLLRHRTLHYMPDMAGKIVYAVAVLHNICIDNNTDLDEELVEVDQDDTDDENEG